MASVTTFNSQDKELDRYYEAKEQKAHATRLVWADDGEGAAPMRYDEPATPSLFDDPDNYDTDGTPLKAA